MSDPFYLHENWILKLQSNRSTPLADDCPLFHGGVLAQVPGTVHTDLLKAGIIDDPFFSDQEIKTYWIDEQDWLYETVFDLPGALRQVGSLNLVCEGLDTFCTIYLNGHCLSKTSNMFRSYFLEITGLVKERQNLLQIYFSPPRQYGRERLGEVHQFPSARHPERVFVRKAQYSFGWDWGPALPTCGIWRPIYLQAGKRFAVQSVRFDTLEIHADHALVKVGVLIEGEGQGKVKIKMHHETRHFVDEIEIKGAGWIETNLRITNPRLWWPNGSGQPHLYHLDVLLFNEDSEEVDCWQKRVGIRTLELLQEDEDEAVFRFILKGKPLFIRGANWIPADSFLPRITDQTYRTLLGLARGANMNMIRVWGGGIYESDLFYTLCDELGLLIWQDFMFACAAYPDDIDFEKEVEAEITENVQRLQHHPCIALWCGNNENEWIAQMEGFVPLTTMPGYRLFHQLFPQRLNQLDPLRPYWPSSPFGQNENPNDPRSGNRHNWDIWSGWKDYTKVKEDTSLFVTEFGFQGSACWDTLSAALHVREYHPQHRVFEFHNKQVEGPERLYRFLSGHLPVVSDADDFIYLTQLNQALALKTCLEHWRLRRPKTSGTIIWQLNDCWPVTSWSLIDYALRLKLAYYWVKQSFGDVLPVLVEGPEGIQLVVDHLADRVFQGWIDLFAFEISSGRLLEKTEQAVEINPHGRKVLNDLPGLQSIKEKQALLIINLFDKDKQLIAQNYYAPLPFKHIHLPGSSVHVETIKQEDSLLFRLNSDHVVLFVTLYHPHLHFERNGFFMVPGYPLQVRAEPLVDQDQVDPAALRIFALNDYLNGQ
jgi:beta-mannosidase